MITFYPGPSKVYPQVADYALEAVHSGIVSLNHRSPDFMAIVEETLALLHEKLTIPANYRIAFVSSATECWEIITQSLTVTTSLHPHTGAFGRKWMEYAHRIKPMTTPNEADVLCLVQNETSNGTQVHPEALAQFRREFSGLIAIDATSSMGGLIFDWTQADVWFASVQKCFGLPAGLGLLVYSQEALQQAQVIADRRYYNSLLFIDENSQKHQTHYTPNGLLIYLLMRVLRHIPPIEEIDALLRKRSEHWYQFIEQETDWQLLVREPLHRSYTVIAVEGSEKCIKRVKLAAQEAGIILGNGYGDGEKTTFRIANFPAIEQAEIDQLKEFLWNFTV